MTGAPYWTVNSRAETALDLISILTCIPPS